MSYIALNSKRKSITTLPVVIQTGSTLAHILELLSSWPSTALTFDVSGLKWSLWRSLTVICTELRWYKIKLVVLSSPISSLGYFKNKSIWIYPGSLLRTRIDPRLWSLPPIVGRNVTLSPAPNREYTSAELYLFLSFL